MLQQKTLLQDERYNVCICSNYLLRKKVSVAKFFLLAILTIKKTSEPQGSTKNEIVKNSLLPN